jgi:putative membrane protein PagO
MPRLRTLFLYLVVVAIWGTTWVAIKATVATVPPITASGLRFAIAFPVLALIVARMPGVPLRYPPGHRRLFALVTVGYFIVPFALMNAGSAVIPSGLAAVLFATVSMLILLFSVPLLGTSISLRQGAGVAVALVALVALIAQQMGIGGHVAPLGALALLGAAALHALVYVLLKRDAGALSPLTLNALPMGLAGLLLCGAGALLEHPDPGAISADSLLAVLYLGAIASVVGFLAYFQLLRELGPVPLSLVFVLFPLIAQVAGVAFGERAMGAGSLGLLVVVLAASLVALTDRRAPRPRTRAAAPAGPAGPAAARRVALALR